MMDDRQFRTAMGKFATGVTVIATEVEGEGYSWDDGKCFYVSVTRSEASCHLHWGKSENLEQN